MEVLKWIWYGLLAILGLSIVMAGFVFSAIAGLILTGIGIVIFVAAILKEYYETK